jgi:hypothetical protein
VQSLDLNQGPSGYEPETLALRYRHLQHFWLGYGDITGDESTTEAPPLEKQKKTRPHGRVSIENQLVGLISASTSPLQRAQFFALILVIFWYTFSSVSGVTEKR